MRLRVLELPAPPVAVHNDGATTYEMGAPVFVLVFDEVALDEEPRISAVAVDEWRTATGARGVLLFRGRVDLPGSD